MRLSTKGRYAVTAMLDLAIHDGKGPITLADISQCQGISLSYLEQLFAKLRREAQALEKLIADLRKALEQAPAPSGQPFERVRGKLPWPVPGRIVAGFGQSRGGGLKWNGVLIATERGTQVRAPYAGRVVYSDWLPGLGLLLIIDHGGGYMTLYGHNEQLYKAVGEAVTAGEGRGHPGHRGNAEAGPACRTGPAGTVCLCLSRPEYLGARSLGHAPGEGVATPGSGSDGAGEALAVRERLTRESLLHCGSPSA